MCMSLMHGHSYEARKLKLCTKVYFYTRMDMRYVALTKRQNIPGRNVQKNIYNPSAMLLEAYTKLLL